MKIGVDMDSVLAEIMIPLVNFHNDLYGTDLKLEDHIHYDLTKVWKCSNDEVLEKIDKFYRSSYFDKTQPVKGAKEGIGHLSKKHELIVITSRPYSIENKTLGWLAKHFPGTFKSVQHTNHINFDKSKKRDKSSVCMELGIKLMIDDCLEFAEDCAGKNIKVLLVDTPWNRSDKLHKNITRVLSWEEIVKLLS